MDFFSYLLGRKHGGGGGGGGYPGNEIRFSYSKEYEKILLDDTDGELYVYKVSDDVLTLEQIVNNGYLRIDFQLSLDTSGNATATKLLLPTCNMCRVADYIITDDTLALAEIPFFQATDTVMISYIFVAEDTAIEDVLLTKGVWTMFTGISGGTDLEYSLLW